MPQCKARFCKVKRGQGISAFAIPDPKKNRQLCKQWIHNLGIKNLDIKTYEYSKQNIVCEKHFEKDCFVKDIKAEIMGYTPKHKHLKPDAVPTIFADSKPHKRRELSERRIEKKKRIETIANLLGEYAENKTREEELATEIPSSSSDNLQMSRKRIFENKQTEEKRPRINEEVISQTKEVVNLLGENDGSTNREDQFSTELPSSSTGDVQILQKKKKRKLVNKQVKGKRLQTNEVLIRETKDASIQVSPDTCDTCISCNMPTDHSCTISCSNCYARNHPVIVMSDHLYHTKPCKKVSPVSLRKKLTNPKKNESDAKSSGKSDDDDHRVSFRTPPNEHTDDQINEPLPMSDNSPEAAQTFVHRDGQPIQDAKFTVFSSCLKKLFTMIRCSTCDSPADADDAHSGADGLTVTFTCKQGHEFKWKSQPALGKCSSEGSNLPFRKHIRKNGNVSWSI